MNRREFISISGATLWSLSAGPMTLFAETPIQEARQQMLRDIESLIRR